MIAEKFDHVRVGQAGDAVVVEVTSREIQGPDLAKAFINDLTRAVEQAEGRPILLDLALVRYLSSMGYSALFKMVKCARERGRPIRFCNMHPDVRVGAVAVNLPMVVEIHDSAVAAIEAFARG
jgi:anti-sigma B factor antagonist